MIPYLPYQRKPFLNFCLEIFHFPILLVPFGREKRPNTEIQPDGGCKMRETDLADELFGQPGGTALPAGVRVATARQGGVTITRVEISREGLARPRGRYVTLEVPSVSLLDERDSAVIEAAAAELRPLLPPEGPVLVLGVGNRRVTADALGPRTVQKVFVTMGPRTVPVQGIRPVAAVAPRIEGYGDYATPEQGVPVVRPEDKYWELCMTMNDSWGYQHTDSNYKSPYILLRTFVDCLSMGGNLLLDIGPKEDGSIPEEQIAVLKEFGRWTKKHKEAIYETRAGIPTEHFQGYTTLNKAGDILYLYLPYKPNGPVEVKGLMNKVNRIWVVGNGAMLNYKVYNKNYWNSVPGNLYIDVPQQVQDEQITVLAVLLDGPIKLYRGVGQVQDNN